MKTRNEPDATRCAAILGCTVEQAKRQFGENAKGLRTMAEKAERTGAKVNGYTSAELRAMESEYQKAAQL